MAIKRRESAREKAKATEVHDDPSDRRHPALSGLRKDVYDYVQLYPGSTRADIADGLRMRSSTATARIKELIDEGYLFEPGSRKINKSGTSGKCLQITDRPQGGKPNDKVRIEVVLTIDHNGVYGTEAHVVDGMPQSGHTFPIKASRISVTAPHPSTYKSSMRDETDNTEPHRISRVELQADPDSIIDADFYTVDDTED